MKITCQNHEQCTVFSLRGELTADEIDEFRKAALEQMDNKPHDFVLDMSQVTFVDSQGLESLLWLQEQCMEKLGQVRLAECPENVNTILRITRLNKTVVACKSIQEAIDSLKA
jgi:anti-anti-sigma factor